MKVLVTGGAGYVRSVPVARLLAARHSVVVFDELSQSHRAAVHPLAVLVVGDLADGDALARVFLHTDRMQSCILPHAAWWASRWRNRSSISGTMSPTV